MEEDESLILQERNKDSTSEGLTVSLFLRILTYKLIEYIIIKPHAPKIKKSADSQRRRPVKTIQTLTSSKFGEKYNILLEKRLVLVEKQIDSLTQDIQLKKEKHKLEIEILKAELEKKSSTSDS